MSTKTVFIHIAMPGRTGDFSDYLPWRHGSYAGRIAYATSFDESNNGRYLTDEIYNKDLPFSGKLIRWTLEPLVADEFRDSRALNYYRMNLSTDAGLWLKVEDYLAHVNNGIAMLVEVQHPHVAWLETLRDDIGKHLELIEQAEVSNIEGHLVDLPITPALSIPKTRFDQFLAQRHTQKGQRFGQAFFNFMDAHKCTQDKAWWDRLWNASDMDARGMINALIDWDN